MDLVPLPRKTTLIVDAGDWILNWYEEAIGLGGAKPDAQPHVTRIGPAAGSDALSETEARRQARRYLLSLIPPLILIQRSQMTLVSFIGERFLPDLLAGKRLPWHAHYYSILKHLLSPEDCERISSVHECLLRGARARDTRWPYLGQLRLRDVRSVHVEQLIKAALERGYSVHTVRQIRSFVSAIFTYAKQEFMYTGANPTLSVTLPTIKAKGLRQLTSQQLEQVLSAMRYPEKQITLIRLLTDMNVSEICGLQWKRVNLSGSWFNCDGDVIPPISISVRRRWYRGELAEAKQIRLRHIPIPEALLPMLLVLRARTGFHGPEDFVLTSRTGSAVNVSNLTARRLGAISRRLGIPQLTLQALHRSQQIFNKKLGLSHQAFFGSEFTSDPLH